MRVVRIEANFDTFLWTVAGHEMNKVTSDLPADAKVLNVDVDPARRAIWFTVESSTFAEVPEAHVIPQWQPTLTVSVTELSMLADLVSNRHADWEASEGKCEDCGEDMGYHTCPT